MILTRFLAFASVILLGVPALVRAECDPAPAAASQALLERDTLTGNWWGIRDTIADKGLTLSLGYTQTFQQPAAGGLDTRSGRATGSYDLELSLDLAKLAHLDGARLYTHVEGSWGQGLDFHAISSLLNVNGDAAGDHPAFVKQLYYEQSLFDRHLIFRLGKVDLTGGFECRGCPVSFDGNSFANSERTQFLNGALINNPTIPFPDKGLAAVVHWRVIDWWYLSAAGGDARANARHAGFTTTFDDEAEFCSVYETGITPEIPSPNGPMVGAYRAGIWYNPRPQALLDGSDTKTGDHGIYLSLDQLILKENNSPDDKQGLGLFARYGLADGELHVIKTFWSCGAQYQGLIPTRDKDVLALGYAQGVISPNAGLTAPHETAVELYYNAQITPWLAISPDLQYVIHPGGDASVSNAVVVGLRIQMTF